MYLQRQQLVILPAEAACSIRNSIYLELPTAEMESASPLSARLAFADSLEGIGRIPTTKMVPSLGAKEHLLADP